MSSVPAWLDEAGNWREREAAQLKAEAERIAQMPFERAWAEAIPVGYVEPAMRAKLAREAS